MVSAVSLLRLPPRQQLLAPDRRDHTPAAALVARFGPVWKTARDCALSVADRAIVKLGVNFAWHAARCCYLRGDSDQGGHRPFVRFGRGRPPPGWGSLEKLNSSAPGVFCFFLWASLALSAVFLPASTGEVANAKVDNAEISKIIRLRIDFLRAQATFKIPPLSWP